MGTSRNLKNYINSTQLNELTQEDLNFLLETDEENYRYIIYLKYNRRGDFERIFPLKSNVDYYSKFFETPRINNLLVWKWLKSEDNIICNYHKKTSEVNV